MRAALQGLDRGPAAAATRGDGAGPAFGRGHRRRELAHGPGGLAHRLCRERAKLNYTGSVYDVPQLRWTQQSFIQPQIHPWDRFFYDPATRNYTIPKYLADLRTRYGGIDAVLVWPTFPQLGLDDRNQFGYIRSMPGGVEGLRAMVAAFHAQGARVLLPYNPWDRGTRRERCGDAPYSCGGTLRRGDPMSDAEAMAVLLLAIDGDGFNGDGQRAIDAIVKFAVPPQGRGGNTGPETGAWPAWGNASWLEASWRGNVRFLKEGGWDAVKVELQICRATALMGDFVTVWGPAFFVRRQ
jgi:hypothetical protein